MLRRPRGRNNWIIIRGQVAVVPGLKELECGDEICEFTVAEAASLIPVKAGGRLARKAACLNKGQEVDVVGRLSLRPKKKEESHWRGVVAASVRPVRPPRSRLRRWVGRTTGTIGSVLLLTAWPGGFGLAMLLAPAIWGAWNGQIVFTFPELPQLRFWRVARYTALALIVARILLAVASLAGIS